MVKMWTDNIKETILDANMDGYIRYASYQLRVSEFEVSSESTNAIAVFNIKENTTYRIRLKMDSRFRVACVADAYIYNQTLTNYYYDPLDTNDTAVYGDYRECEITSQSGQTNMVVFYWTSTGASTWPAVYETLEVYEYADATLGVTPPTKTTYEYGEDLDLTGMEVYWDLGYYRQPITDGYTVTGYDPTTLGTQTVTVTYDGESATFSVLVENSVVSIEVTPPTKTTYEYGDALDLTGMVVTALLSNGEIITVTDECTVSGYDSSIIGSQTVTVSFDGQSGTFEVVVENVVVGIVVTPPTKTVYEYGEDLDLTGMTVSEQWKNGDIVPVESGYTVTGYSSTTVGEQEITVTYGEYTSTFSIKVENVMVGIIVTPPTKVTYQYGEELDLTGMVVTAQWKNGDITTLEYGYMISGYAPTQLGEQVVSVESNGFLTTFSVTVDNVVTAITVTPPIKTEYLANEALDLTGMVVTAQWIIGDPTIVESGYTVKKGTYSIERIAPVTVTYLGASDTFYIDILSTRYLGNPTITDVVGYLNYRTGHLNVVGTGAIIDDAYYESSTVTKKIKSIHIGDGVTEVGYRMFDWYCDSLETVTMADSVTEIKYCAFFSSNNLTAVKLSPNVEIIGQSAFGMCRKLTDFVFPEKLTTIGQSAFDFCGFEGTVEIPDTVTSIGYYAFQGCQNIDTIKLPKGLKNILLYLFNGCKSLKTIIWPDELKTIGESAFASCSSLESLEIPNTVTSISASAFKSCTSLKSVTLPPSVTYVGGSAFTGTSALTSFYVLNDSTNFNGKFLETATTIYGYTGSTAQTYAETYGNPFIHLDGAFVVNFHDVDGNIISTQEVMPGESATAPEYDPDLEGEIFSGWDTDFTNVQSDLEVYPFFVPGNTVRFYNFENAEIKKERVPYGQDATAPPDPIPVVEGLVFAGWDTDFTNVRTNLHVRPIAKEKTITATFMGYRTSTQAWEVVKEEVVEYGGDATPPDLLATPQYFYYLPESESSAMAFSRWEECTNLVEDRTINAVYETEMRQPTSALVKAVPDCPILYNTNYGIPGYEVRTYGVLLDSNVGAKLEIQPKDTTYLLFDEDKNELEVTKLYEVLTPTKDIDWTNPGATAMDAIPAEEWDNYFSLSDDKKTIVFTRRCMMLARPQAKWFVPKTETYEAYGELPVLFFADEATEITSVKIIPEEEVLCVGDSTVLAVDVTAAANANPNLYWESSDSSVVTTRTYSSGKIEAVAPGTATITATAMTDPRMTGTCTVHVLTYDDYAALYNTDSLHKETVIHSVDGLFDDIKNSEIVSESMTIQESISETAPLYLGGCISNSFQILISGERFKETPPSGEIQVYQIIDGLKIDLFHGVIDTAKRQENRMVRKITAYDKLHSTGKYYVNDWFTDLNFPLVSPHYTLIRDLLKKMGIPYGEYPIRSLLQKPIYAPTAPFTTTTGDPFSYYSVPDNLTGVDVIQGFCEAYGFFGWINHHGVFEFIKPQENGKKLHPIDPTTLYSEDNPSTVLAVQYSIDEKECDPLIYPAENEAASNQIYRVDDANFYISCSRGNQMNYYSYDEFDDYICEQIFKCIAGQVLESFECQQRYDPAIHLGDIVTYTSPSEGWSMRSIVLSRTITGNQSVKETIRANIGGYGQRSQKQETTKTDKLEKDVSTLKKTITKLVETTATSYMASPMALDTGGVKIESVAELPTNPEDGVIYLIQEGGE